MTPDPAPATRYAQRSSLRRRARLDTSGRSSTQGPSSLTDSGLGSQLSCAPSDRPARMTWIRPVALTARVTGASSWEGTGMVREDLRQLDPRWLEDSVVAGMAAANVRDEGVALVFEGKPVG